VRPGVTGVICDDVRELPAALLRVGELDPADCVAHVHGSFSAGLMASRYEAVYRRVMTAYQRLLHTRAPHLGPRPYADDALR